MNSIRRIYIALLLSLSFGGILAGNDMEIIRKRIISEYLKTVPSGAEIDKLIKTIRTDGSWPGINYEELSRVGYENKIHVTNIRSMCLSYKNPASGYFLDSQLKSVISLALDYWIANDFIAGNWHTNEISNPLDWNCVLLLMDKDLTRKQANAIAGMAGRANLDAWGARPGGDRIKIAGIMAELAVWRNDEATLKKAVATMAEEIKISSGLGIKPDLGFHHRSDRVTAILSYGTGYTGAFANWAERLAGTQFSFPVESMKLMIDFYLDGICKSMIHGWYKAPGLMNRGMAHAGALRPVKPEIPAKLLAISDYRKNELENIVRIREGKQSPNLTYSKYFTHSDYLIHQRPGYYTTVRIYSDRNHNMEAPHNMESLKQHHYADGANFISRTGDEHYDIYAAWDWQKIPGTTVVQKPSLPGWNEIVKKGKTDFAGAASNGKYGLAAFDFDSPHDPLKARKSWFFFDNEYVCLGAGIWTGSDFTAATTLNQCLLRGDVVVKSGNKQSKLTKGDHSLKQVNWIYHDGIAYMFSAPADVSLNNRMYTGRWQDIVASARAKAEPESQREIFSAWLDHGKQCRDKTYEYCIALVPDPAKTDALQKKPTTKTLSNTPHIQAVWHNGLQMAQVVFYQPGKLELTSGLTLDSDLPGLFLVETDGKEIKRITVADPSRKLKSVRFQVSGKFSGSGVFWKTESSSSGQTAVLVVLPSGAQAGESVVLENNSNETFAGLGDDLQPNSGKPKGKHFIGEKFGGGVVFWVDETGDHGLIAAEKDITNNIGWRNGPSKKTQHFGDHADRVTFARSDGIFAGERNTMLIIAQLTEDNPAGNFAARACAEAVIGGFGDWYLPSKTELQLMYNLKDLIGEFNEEMYWSSTEYNVGFVWIQNFRGYGGQYSQNKSGSYSVRCVRRF
jgi:chondroitin AC lyase